MKMTSSLVWRWAAPAAAVVCLVGCGVVGDAETEDADEVAADSEDALRRRRRPRPDAGPEVDAGPAVTDGGAESPPATDASIDSAVDSGPLPPLTRPGPTNTGVPAGTTLTVHEGDLTITEDGTVIDALDIRGWLRISASNVTVRRSIIRGRAGATGNGAGVEVRGGTNVLLEDTEIRLASPSRYIDGLWLGYSGAATTTARRIAVSGGVDGMKVGSNTRVESSWIHGNVIFPDDPNVGGQTHNDCVQVLSGTNIVLANNSLEAARDDNAALQVTQDFGLVTGLVVSGNWSNGGGCTFNFAHKVRTSLSGVTVTNNRFGRGSYYDCPILESTATTLTMSGNVWDDTGLAVPVQRHD